MKTRSAATASGREPAGTLARNLSWQPDNPLIGIGIRFGIIYAVLVVLTSPFILGLRADWAASLVGLGRYPLQGSFVVRTLASLIAAGFWWNRAADRRQEADLRQLCLTTIRFVLAAALLTSGFAKLLHVQMPWPVPPDWIRPIREMPPLHYVMAWTGASRLHETVLALAELTAGMGLLFRRTVTFGALVGIGVLGNALMIAISFDDPRVGSYWPLAEISAMASVLVLFDLPRLKSFFVFEERITEPTPLGYRWSIPAVRRAEPFAKPIFFAGLLLINVPTVIRAYDATHASPLRGVYRVERFTLDGQDSLPDAQAGDAWKLVAIDDCQRFAVRTVRDIQIESSIVLPDATPLQRPWERRGPRRLDRYRRCAEATAPPSGTLVLGPMDSTISLGKLTPGPAGELRYLRSETGLTLEGTLAGRAIAARLTRVPDDFYSVTRYPRPRSKGAQ